MAEPIRGFQCDRCGNEATCQSYSWGYRYECLTCNWYDEEYVDDDDEFDTFGVERKLRGRD